MADSWLARGESEHARQASGHVDRRAIGGVGVISHRDVVNERPNDGQEFAGSIAVRHGLPKQSDPPSIARDDLRMKDDGWKGFVLGQSGLRRIQCRLSIPDGLGHLRDIGAGGQGIDQPFDLRT